MISRQDTLKDLNQRENLHVCIHAKYYLIESTIWSYIAMLDNILDLSRQPTVCHRPAYVEGLRSIHYKYH